MSWWVRQESNLQSARYERDTLPLCYLPEDGVYHPIDTKDWITASDLTYESVIEDMPPDRIKILKQPKKTVHLYNLFI